MTGGYVEPFEELTEFLKPGIYLLFSHKALFGSVLNRLNKVRELQLNS